jgi:hypothetical protein
MELLFEVCYSRLLPPLSNYIGSTPYLHICFKELLPILSHLISIREANQKYIKNQRSD